MGLGHLQQLWKALLCDKGQDGTLGGDEGSECTRAVGLHVRLSGEARHERKQTRRRDLHRKELRAGDVALRELDYQAEGDLVQLQPLDETIAQLEHAGEDFHAQDHAAHDVVHGRQHVEARARHLHQRGALGVRSHRLNKQLEATRLNKRSRRRRRQQRTAAEAQLSEHRRVSLARVETRKDEAHATSVEEQLAQEGLRFDHLQEWPPGRELHLLLVPEHAQDTQKDSDGARVRRAERLARVRVEQCREHLAALELHCEVVWLLAHLLDD
mmetsp:Transcript_58300/g.115707  ORF Transcript_58300/g.115707 Transcript_58300/m.115707 type:complete len:270 (+) Transcript_58300:945-1754(+)